MLVNVSLAPFGGVPIKGGVAIIGAFPLHVLCVIFVFSFLFHFVSFSYFPQAYNENASKWFCAYIVFTTIVKLHAVTA